MHFVYFIIVLYSNAILISTEQFPIKLTVTENQDGAGKEIIHLRKYIKQKKLPINLNITGNNGRTFRFVKSTGNVTINFLLDSKSGSLQLRSSLDREEFCSSSKLRCIINLLINCGNDNNVIKISITIIDENDNRPKFFPHAKSFSIQENSDIGLQRALPIAEDRDSEPYNIRTYKMKNLMTNTMSNYYNKSATYYFDVITKKIGQLIRPYLKIKQKIDRELTKDFKFLLIAEDTRKLTGTTTISIIITDSNDNSPEWSSKQITKTIKECSNYGQLFELQAFDKDDSSTPNGRITYRISDHSPKLDSLMKLFYIEGSKFFLSTQPVNVHNIPKNGRLSFFITARDGGGRENDISVVITIEDCNDHAPRIDLEVQVNSIRENDKRALRIAQFTVKDSDKGINSDFECNLNDSLYYQMTKTHDFSDTNPNGNGPKFVMYSIEKLADRSFDRETINHYTVLIQCVDHGTPQLTGESRLTVSISDENDNPPRFPKREFDFAVVENNYISTTVGQVRAFDPDLGVNGRVKYRILEQKYSRNHSDSTLYVHSDSAASLFTITEQGVIETATQFDREQIFEYRIRVQATDSSKSGALNDTCIVRIRVLDVNDCVPVFKNQYFYQVTESDGQANIHSILGDVRAYDYDLGENGTLTYQLRLSNSVDYNVSKTALGLLQLTRNGKLSIHGRVDRERFESLQAELVAIDNGKVIKQTGTTTIIIDILDLNDNKPLFRIPPRNRNRYSSISANHGQMEISINVTLDTPVGSDIYTFKAEDPDKGENGTITYSIIGYKNWFPFSLQKNGILILEKSLLNTNNNYQNKQNSKNDKKGSRKSMLNVIKRYPETLLIKASDGGVNPRSGMMTLKIKYIQSKNSNYFDYKNPNWNAGNPPQSGGNSKYLGNNKYHGNNDNYNGNNNMDGPSEDVTPDSLILLFILAAVLFVVFLVVLLILLYTYFTGRLTRSHRNNNQSGIHHDKNINNYKKEFNNYECELLNPENQNFQATLGKMATVQNDTSIKSDKTNYTHLIAMRDSKYTPIHFQSNFNPNQSQFIQNYSIATHSISPNTLTNNCNSSNYGNTMLNNNINSVTQSTPQRTFIPHSPPINRCVTVSPTSASVQPRWNSIENLTSKPQSKPQSNNTLIRPSTHKQNPYNKSAPFNTGILYNSHSYAAYINQFGKSSQDDQSVDNHLNEEIAMAMTIMTDNKDKKGQTLPAGLNSNDLVHYEALQGHNNNNNDNNISPQNSSNKKSYVTSSFV